MCCPVFAVILSVYFVLSRLRCKDCLVEERPNRGTTCLDDGAYILNFQGCGKRSIPKNIKCSEELEDDGDEEVIETTFSHSCIDCGHIIASHYFRETTTVESIRYMMECVLCGSSAQEKESKQRDLDGAGVCESTVQTGAEDDPEKREASTVMFAHLKNMLPTSIPQADDSDDGEWENDD